MHKKFGVIKGAGLFLWPVFSVFLLRRGIITTRTTYRFLATICLLTLTFFFIILSRHHHVTCPGFTFVQPCSPSGSLQNSFTEHFISISAQYTHFLVWIFGPSRLFSRSNYFFFFVFWRSLTFFQKTTGPEITVASPNIQVSHTFLRPNSDTDDIPPSYSGSHFQCIFWYLFNPRCFLRSREVDLGEFDWRFVYVHLLIPLFLVAQFVIYHPKTETHQAKALRR